MIAGIYGGMRWRVLRCISFRAVMVDMRKYVEISEDACVMQPIKLTLMIVGSYKSKKDEMILAE